VRVAEVGPLAAAVGVHVRHAARPALESGESGEVRVQAARLSAWGGGQRARGRARSTARRRAPGSGCGLACGVSRADGAPSRRLDVQAVEGGRGGRSACEEGAWGEQGGAWQAREEAAVVPTSSRHAASSKRQIEAEIDRYASYIRAATPADDERERQRGGDRRAPGHAGHDGEHT